MLWHTQINDDGLKSLAGLEKLQVLSLEDTAISDAGLKHLYGLKQLKELTLRLTKVSAEGITELKAALPKLKIGT